MKSLCSLFLGCALALGSASAFAQEKLMVYTSMKESLIGKLREEFVKKNPKVTMDYYSAGAGKLMAKLAAERQSGKILADVLWHSEVPDFYQLKQDGLFEKYISPEAKNTKSPVKDPDGYFTPLRMAALGIVYNTKRSAFVPKTWADLYDPQLKNKFVLANPALSGTSFMSCAMLEQKFSWAYFQKIKANGGKIGHGSGQVVDDTAAGDFNACIGVDYIALDKIQKGANMAITFPSEMIVIPSPAAIIKGSPNAPAARKFIDFVLSKDGQSIIAATGTLPVRSDVPVAKGTGLPSVDEAIKRAIPMDYPNAIKLKEPFLKKFAETMR